MLKNKKILLCVSGSIAAFKAATLCSALIKEGADVHVLMTENGGKFVSPMTFESLSGNSVSIDTFSRHFKHNTDHIALATDADLLIVAPASANIIAKLAHGIADDMVSTTCLACRCKKMIAPAMNTAMYENPITQSNLQALRDFGFSVVSPTVGRLACGETGAGKMAEPEILLEAVQNAIAHEQDMAGINLLVTAGATREALDPVRFLTNRSSGKMGFAVARAAVQRGACVTLVSGASHLTPPLGAEFVTVDSAADMAAAVCGLSPLANIVVMAAAVADFTPAKIAAEKLKKADGMPEISLVQTTDILKTLGESRIKGQFLCGFSMESENLLANSRAKLTRKNVDMIAANSIRDEGAGFAGDTNLLTIITREDEIPLPLLSKLEAAHRLLDEILKRR